jgi:hypothetical protein
MKLSPFSLTFTPVLIVALIWFIAATPALSIPQTKGYKISGPYSHSNLTVYLIHGNDQIKHKKFQTLQEALDQGKVTVYETSSVNELVIENRSQDAEVYIQSGDIVKGGKQDRVISIDIILPPRSGKIRISAFCVEQGRWRQRQGETVTHFGSSSDHLATKQLKRAVKESAEQGEVWQEVANAQRRLEKTLGGRVSSDQSATSLQLTLENKQVRLAADGYVKALSTVLEDKPDVIGYAFAINGQVNSADIYASSDLFRRLWPKLLRATAIEAVAERGEEKSYAPPPPKSVQTMLTDADSGPATARRSTPTGQMVTRETGKNIVFETRDEKQKDGWIHKNYMTKESTSGSQPPPRRRQDR